MWGRRLAPRVLSIAAVVALLGVAVAWRLRPPHATVEQRLAQYGAAARARLAPHFAAAGVNYPPHEVALIGVKDRRVLELWARDGARAFTRVRSYPMLAASGGPGPKLREGDRQVPEGLYAIESLHPNSRFHLALRVDYPNAFDRARARADGRTELGGDIMIHGSDVSVGCLAMGDTAIEELFTLAADSGPEHVRIILTPVDLPVDAPPDDALPGWTAELYAEIARELESVRGDGSRADGGPPTSTQ